MGVIMIASQITIVYSTVYTDVDQRKHQSSASLAFVWGIHRGPVNSPHKRPVMRKMFPFDDVIVHCWNSNVVKMTTLDAAGDKYFIEMSTFSLQLYYNTGPNELK